jgi:hypothetical protein
MALINQGGKLLLRGAALASGVACCCNNNNCSGPCDAENPCPEGCDCVDGVCVNPPDVCDQYCYQVDAPGAQCGNSPEGECECPPGDRVGVECFYRTPSGGGPCPDGDLPDNFQNEPLEGCWNSDDPDWCLCSVIAADEQDCFQNYEYLPEGFPRTPEQEADCAEFPNENGGCGGLITNPQIGNCVPVENPLP